MAKDSIGVLVVEDEAVAAAAHAEYVARLPQFHMVAIARTAGQAMSVLLGEQRDLPPSAIRLVLLDMNLPDGHGLELCRAIRGRHIAVDIMAVTAARDMKVLQEALALGVVHYLIKPFTFPTFKSKLEGYLGYRKSLPSRASGSELTQSDVDQALGALRESPGGSAPKGMSRPTLDTVLDTLRDEGGMSATELADSIGISRVTARRYLESLSDAGQVERRPRYGSTGRPVLEYRLD